MGLTTVKRGLGEDSREALDNIKSRIPKKYWMEDFMEEDLSGDHD